MTDTTFEIDIRDVFYRYDAESNALDGISLRIPSGQFLCILGGNGSGKSTLAKHMNALLVPDEGSVHILGVDTRDPDNVFFVRSNAGMVFQNPDDQLVSSIIEDDVAFGPENLGLDPAVIRERVTEALQSVGLQGFEKRACASLSGGQKQRVAIAGVLAMDPQILILDEASAMLDPRGRHGLLKACKALNERGLTIVFITHFMDEAAEADRIIVLDNGKIALDGTPDEVLVQTAMLDALSLEVPFAVHMSTLLRDNDIEIGLHIDDDSLIDCLAETLESTSRNTIIADQRIIPSSSASVGENVGSSRDCTESLIRFEHVSFTYSEKRAKRGNKSTSDADAQTVEPAIWGNDPDSYWALHDISLNLRKGDVLGIAGHTGSGKSTLIQLANGLLKPTEGHVYVNGVDIASKRDAAEARRNVGLVFQYPEHQLFAATVFDDVAFGPRNLGLSASEVEERVETALRLVHLDPADMRNRNPFALSGGQQRRVAFAGVLAMNPQILILDEPAAGLDPHARASFMQLIRELHESSGLSVIIVSHDMDALGAFCNRLIVLNQGHIAFEGTPSAVFSHAEELRAIGLGVPHTIALCNELKSRGLYIGQLGDEIHPPTASELANALAALNATDKS